VVGCEKRELGFIECMMRVAAKMFCTHIDSIKVLSIQCNLSLHLVSGTEVAAWYGM
jgi:hypothetical protein